jgi:branched-chain amino acid transport system substrate-binding protein
MNGRLAAASFAAGCLLALAGCAAPGPVRVGFIATISGPNADMGSEGRDAAMLALEDQNARGGINGAPLELVIVDDRGTAEGGREAARSLIGRNVVMAIGTYTSAMAEAEVPLFNAARIVLVSPNVEAMQYVGVDDWFFRINNSARDNAVLYARFLSAARDSSPTAVIWDADNARYAQDWLREFTAAFAAAGGRVKADFPFTHLAGEDYAALAARVAAIRPRTVLFIASAYDSARFAQLLRKAGCTAPFAASEWAGTSQLMELGGMTVQGLLILQEYDPFDAGAAYQSFRDQCMSRFKHQPTLSSVLTWDAAQVAFTTLRDRRRGETVKQALLRIGAFRGLQQEVVIDSFGDARRLPVFSRILDGVFVRAD